MSHITHLQVRGPAPALRPLTRSELKRSETAPAGNQHRTPMRWPRLTGNSGARKPNSHERPSLSHGEASLQSVSAIGGAKRPVRRWRAERFEVGNHRAD